MNLHELREQIDIERDSIDRTLAELLLLKRDLAEREPSVRDLAAAGLFLANFYTGIENIFKRLCRYHELEIPAGADWHLELTRRMTQPLQEGCPKSVRHEICATEDSQAAQNK